MKVLIATDGSIFSRVAVEEVAGRDFPPETEVQIVAAYERTSRLMAFESMGALREYATEIDSHALKAAEDASEQAVKILQQKNPNLVITTVIVEGSPKDVILKQAEAFDADLIVVGSHGHGAVERFLLGSVSQAVALHAKCSVEIVRKRNVSSGK